MKPEELQAELIQMRHTISQALESIAVEVEAMSFGGSKNRIIGHCDCIARAMDLPEYDYVVDVSTGQGRRVSYLVEGER